MIKASELRIGNRYNRKHGKGWTEVVINEKILSAIFNDDSSDYALNDFEPIPLTPEILQLFGFERRFKNSPKDWSLDHSGIKHDVYFLFINGKIQLAYSDDWGDNEASVELQFLHQIQNLFHAITGEELRFVSGENVTLPTAKENSGL
jgi:hypothetical protein